MDYIKELKRGKIIGGIMPKTLDENDNEVWNIPKDLDEFKALAIDTINWRVGRDIKKTLGSLQVNLSASNSKAITLLAKLIKSANPDTDTLTDLEKSAFDKLALLGEQGYSDSELLNKSLDSVTDLLPKASDKVARITSATSHDEVIEVLNE